MEQENNEKVVKRRTLRQNAALHTYFTLLAEALNEAGLDFRKTLKQDIDVPWSADLIKNYMWRPVQKIQLGKESTTELTTREIDKVFDTLNRHLGTRFGIHIPFPSVSSEEEQLKQE